MLDLIQQMTLTVILRCQLLLHLIIPQAHSIDKMLSKWDTGPFTRWSAERMGLCPIHSIKCLVYGPAQLLDNLSSKRASVPSTRQFIEWVGLAHTLDILSSAQKISYNRRNDGGICCNLLRKFVFPHSCACSLDLISCQHRRHLLIQNQAVELPNQCKAEDNRSQRLGTVFPA